jgi:biotin-dependent carboxylase-like uncharacterized protein
LITILRPGPFATVQDLGRPGMAGIGVGASGAADQPSLRLANRLVGNPESHAGVEITFGGLSAGFGQPAIIALTGAPCPARLSGRAVDLYTPIHVPAGARLDLDLPAAGLRTYLAIRGGIAVDEVLRSRATDTMSGLGPDPLKPGTVLPIGMATLKFPAVDFAPQPPFPDTLTLRVIPGPRDDWFVPQAVDTLISQEYRISSDSNRVGLRLIGPALAHQQTRELPSEATVLGALQVPPSGQPILFLADHPVTGGYPVIAVVHEADVPLAAQGRPGQIIHFRL